MMGRLNPKSSEIAHLFFCVILVVYLGHGNFHPGSKQFFFLVQISFLVRGSIRKKVVHLYGSTRLAEGNP